MEFERYIVAVVLAVAGAVVGVAGLYGKENHVTDAMLLAFFFCFASCTVGIN